MWAYDGVSKGVAAMNKWIPSRLPDLAALGREGLDFLLFAFGRFREDNCLRVAASLSYTSMLALVPLLAIAFAIFGAFPAFDDIQREIRAFIFQNFVPTAGDVVHDMVDGFLENTGKMSSFGAVGLALTAVLLLNTIESAFNTIWRVPEVRSPLMRVLAFWALLTLGPLLFGASLSVSSYLFTIAQSSGVEDVTGPLVRLASLVPLALAVAGLTLLYVVIPNRPVRWRHALAGGLIAGILFELLKKGFGLYVANFPSYQTIYGAFAALPIFLVWMYLCWSVVILGAVFTASMPGWRESRRQGQISLDSPATRLEVALAILARLTWASKRNTEGRPPGIKTAKLMRKMPVTADAFDQAVAQLTRTGFIVRSGKGRLLLACEIEETTVYELYRALGLALEPPNRQALSQASWQRRFAELMERAQDSEAELMNTRLKALLAADPPAEAAVPPAEVAAAE